MAQVVRRLCSLAGAVMVTAGSAAAMANPALLSFSTPRGEPASVPLIWVALPPQPIDIIEYGPPRAIHPPMMEAEKIACAPADPAATANCSRPPAAD